MVLAQMPTLKPASNGETRVGAVITHLKGRRLGQCHDARITAGDSAIGQCHVAPGLPVPARPLTTADLCDRCSARAAVETVILQGGSLLWCAHHFAFFQDALNAFGTTILVDERRR